MTQLPTLFVSKKSATHLFNTTASRIGGVTDANTLTDADTFTTFDLIQQYEKLIVFSNDLEEIEKAEALGVPTFGTTEIIWTAEISNNYSITEIKSACEKYLSGGFFAYEFYKRNNSVKAKTKLENLLKLFRDCDKGEDVLSAIANVFKS